MLWPGYPGRNGDSLSVGALACRSIRLDSSILFSKPCQRCGVIDQKSSKSPRLSFSGPPPETFRAVWLRSTVPLGQLERFEKCDRGMLEVKTTACIDSLRSHFGLHATCNATEESRRADPCREGQVRGLNPVPGPGMLVHFSKQLAF